MQKQNQQCWQQGALRLGSKYRAHIGISQEQMDKLADKFPEINDISKFDNFSAIIQNFINKIIDGTLVEKAESKKGEVTEKIKEQQYLALCLKNWKSLKESDETFDNAKAIITGKKTFDAPKITELIEPQPDEPEFEGFNEMGYCGTCKHLHFNIEGEPRTCKATGCNCGVRG